MFSWRKKENDAVVKSVELVQSAMKQGKTKTKLVEKSTMQDQVVEVLKTHANLAVKLGEPTAVPQIVKDKLKVWDGVRLLVLQGTVHLDINNSGHDIPLHVLVHGRFPAVPPICFVTGDIYIPKWDLGKTTLSSMIGTILLECAQARFINTEACGSQVEGLILSGDEDFDWASFEAARVAQEAARPKAATRTKRAPLFAVTDDTPSSFICPISLEVMVDPVIAADGQNYERDEIEDWLATHTTSPLTNEELPSKELMPNAELQKQIHDHHKQTDPKYRERYLLF
eukprot:CAMPEP_0196738182 /NCGR_PEP_ID=MMETSP1091-20130531/15678_1 /TAXON_ID=302021 /ORGANISM="Rhodomonas sp., Strain CCMP768" /LENGTH=283 /DNA_ID=CAMNT_0042082137 /DNA_START=35 /DNA_END=886 /DNA_ORIENTATION=+